MLRPILNIADVELEPLPPSHAPPPDLSDRFGARMGELGGALGSTKLGYNLTVVEPGKRAFPLHNHWVNEEMFYVISGRGELRIGEETYAIGPGDVIACPPGPRASAHQIINNSAEELRYLAVSTMLSPEVVEYPDSGKFGVRAETPGSIDGDRVFRYRGRADASLDYWDGE